MPPRCNSAGASDAANDAVRDDVGRALGEGAGLRDPGLGAVADAYTPAFGVCSVTGSTATHPSRRQARLSKHVGHLVGRDPDEQVVRLVVVLELRDPRVGVNPWTRWRFVYVIPRSAIACSSAADAWGETGMGDGCG